VQPGKYDPNRGVGTKRVILFPARSQHDVPMVRFHGAKPATKKEKSEPLVECRVLPATVSVVQMFSKTLFMLVAPVSPSPSSLTEMVAAAAIVGLNPHSDRPG